MREGKKTGRTLSMRRSKRRKVTCWFIWYDLNIRLISYSLPKWYSHTSYRHLPTNQAAEESRPQPIQRTSTSLSAFDRNQHIHYSTLTDGGLRGFHDFIKLVLALNVAAGVAIVALEGYRCLLVEWRRHGALRRRGHVVHVLPPFREFLVFFTINLLLSYVVMRWQCVFNFPVLKFIL